MEKVLYDYIDETIETLTNIRTKGVKIKTFYIDCSELED
jgi:hypothetical protein